MNKKLRNLKKRLRHSKNSTQSISASKNSEIESLQKEVKGLQSKLSGMRFENQRLIEDHKSESSKYKELECFRSAIAAAQPFRSHACDILNFNMQIDLRAFEYGMFKIKNPTPLCKILHYVEHDVGRQVSRLLQDHVMKKGIHREF